MAEIRLALLHADGSCTILAPAETVERAYDLCDDANSWEPRRDRFSRVVRVAVEVIEDVLRPELAAAGIDGGDHG